MQEKTVDTIATVASLTAWAAVFIAIPFKSIDMCAPAAKKAGDATFDAVKKWLS